MAEPYVSWPLRYESQHQGYVGSNQLPILYKPFTIVISLSRGRIINASSGIIYKKTNFRTRKAGEVTGSTGNTGLSDSDFANHVDLVKHQYLDRCEHKLEAKLGVYEQPQGRKRLISDLSNTKT